MTYWRLSLFYFCYFASLGALVPYWGLYLSDLGFDALAIGQLTSLLMVTKILSPNLWGWLADRSGRRLELVRGASLVSALVFMGVFWAREFWSLALVMVLFSFFWNASLPQLEVITCNYLGVQIRRYASIRLWGSVGFILAVVGLGQLLEHRGTSLVPQVLVMLFLTIWLSSLLVPDAPSSHQEQQVAGLWATLRRPEVLAFLVACFAQQASHGAYYAFYSIYLAEQGYAKPLIGALWGTGVLVEVLTFLGMHQLLHRFGARRLLLASLGLAVLRWLLIGAFPHQLPLLFLAQTLHAATFGTFHASAIHLVHHYFPGRLQGRGQALYASMSFGAGGALGTLVSGYVWEGIGPAAAFWVSASGAALGGLIAWRWVDRNHRF